MTYRITELIPIDHVRYANFLAQGLAEHPDVFRLTVADEQAAPFVTRGTPDSFTLIATNDADDWLGVVSFERDGPTREKLRHKGLLFRMYVAPLAAGRGVGRALIGAVIDRARTLPGMEQINLTVVATNDRAKRLYESVGFVRYGLEPRAIKTADGRYFDEELMALRL